MLAGDWCEQIKIQINLGAIYIYMYIYMYIYIEREREREREIYYYFQLFFCEISLGDLEMSFDLPRKRIICHYLSPYNNYGLLDIQ